MKKADLTDIKTSFAPISSPEIKVLILGSMPGDRSIALSEYYGHAQNRFWRILAAISGNEVPLTYPEKKKLLKDLHIGVWDVAHKATRKGSLDSAMRNVEPNDLEAFIAKHKKLTRIAFNGQKAQALHDRFFRRRPEIIYHALPSSSPANARMSFEIICGRWQALLADREKRT